MSMRSEEEVQNVVKDMNDSSGYDLFPAWNEGFREGYRQALQWVLGSEDPKRKSEAARKMEAEKDES